MLRSFGSLTVIVLLLVGCGGGGGSISPWKPSIVVATALAPPEGVVTNAYPGFMFAVATAGSQSPWTWAVISGGLPGGLTRGADGSPTGTPESRANL